MATGTTELHTEQNNPVGSVVVETLTSAVGVAVGAQLVDVAHIAVKRSRFWAFPLVGGASVDSAGICRRAPVFGGL